MRLILKCTRTSALVSILIVTITVALGQPAYAIIGGEPADPSVSGFVARLYVDRGPFRSTETCTGVLVAPALVLTAAHCLKSHRPSDWSATFSYGTNKAEKRNVSQIISYSSVSGENNHTSVDDIAVLQLDQAVTDRSPAVLENDPQAVSSLAEASAVEYGYGEFRSGQASYSLKAAGEVFMGATPEYSNRPTPPALLEAIESNVSKVPPGYCAEGDSGGPLVLGGNGDGPLLGVLSTSANDGTNNICLYTRVDAGDPYRSWLDQMISQYGSGTS